MVYSISELKNILRIYRYTMTALAADIGITKSYLSKIINRKVISRKYENLLMERILEIQKGEPRNHTKKRRYKYWKFLYAGSKDIPLRNAIQIILDKNKITVTDLARDIGEARSSVSQVIIGLRRTGRIQKKITDYLKLDGDIFFNRTPGDIEDLRKGVLVPLPTKAEAKKRKKEQAKLFHNLRPQLGNLLF